MIYTIAMGFFIIFSGAMLFWLSRVTASTDRSRLHRADRNWMSPSQRRMRHWVNSLLILVGCGVITTSFIEHRQTWAISWLVIIGVLLVIMILAMVDAIRLIVHYRRAVPKIAQETLAVKNSASARELQNESPTAMQ